MKWAFWEEEQELAPACKEFAEQFFGIPLAERQRRWEELLSRCFFAPHLQARLRALEPGLTVDPGLDASDHTLVGRLIQQTCALFTRPPGEQLLARQELLRAVSADPSGWAKAARHVQQHRPEIASLAPECFDRILSWRKRRRQAAWLFLCRCLLVSREEAAVAPAAVGIYLEEHGPNPDVGGLQLAQAVSEDWPLHLAYLLHRLA